MQTTINHHPVREVWTKAGPIETTTADELELRHAEEVHKAAIGDPTPMGIFGFATGTLVIGFVMAGITPITSLPAVIPSVFIFAGIAQFIAALYAFSRGNTFAGTVMGSFGANNVLVSTFIWMQHTGFIGKGAPENELLGVGLCCLGYIALALTIAALPLNASYAGLIAALIPGYALPGIHFLGLGGHGNTIMHWGGYFLLLSALWAFYAGAALVINSTHQREVLGLARIKRTGKGV